jgi:cell fate regulator YaaT (PSP1 superfamily)
MTDETEEVSSEDTQDIVQDTNDHEPQEQTEQQELQEKEQDAAQETEQSTVQDAEQDCKPEGGCCYRLKVLHSNETHLCRSEECDLNRDDLVLMQSRYGKDLAKVTGIVRDTDAMSEEDIAEILGKATEKELKHYDENLDRAKEAMKICKEKIEQHKLDMKLVSAHYLDDNTKVLFFFTAEARVDFRALVKDLVSVFKMRIELRQIGVRDESRVLGGVAVCGRTYCCSGLTDRLRPVSIKMAKEQNLSLNSMKISGPCGRLLCCLSYEYDFYKEEKSKLPSEGHKIQMGKVYFRVSEVNILSKRIQVTGPDGSYYYLPFEKFVRKGDGSWKILDLETDE